MDTGWVSYRQYARSLSCATYGVTGMVGMVLWASWKRTVSAFLLSWDGAGRC